MCVLGGGGGGGGGGYLAARLTYLGDGHGRDAVKRLTLVTVMRQGGMQ